MKANIVKLIDLCHFKSQARLLSMALVSNKHIVYEV